VVGGKDAQTANDHILAEGLIEHLNPPTSMSEGWSQRSPLTMKDPLNNDISRSQLRY
jgi:hypothetical protein